MSSDRFSAPRPRKLILAVHSKTISEYEVDKGSAPHPSRACLVIRGGAPAFISSPGRRGGRLVYSPAEPFPRVLGSAPPRGSGSPAGAANSEGAERAPGQGEGSRAVQKVRRGGERMEDGETAGRTRGEG